jgi:TonB family protein
MATDIARIKLELASGRNEATAPFHQTAARRHKPPEEPLTVEAPPELPSHAQVVVDVPLGNAETWSAPSIAPEVTERLRVGRPNLVALAGAIIAVIVLIGWAMAQRSPEVDPREALQRDLAEARSAMAEGRYTDPPGRSAYHYYSAILAVEPNNADAIAGIDAIADRHLTEARVLLSEQRVAEAGVAIEKARRVRPDHSSLLALDVQLRIELRKILAAANAALQAEPVKAKPAAKATTVAPPSPKPVLAEASSEPPKVAAKPARDLPLLALAQTTLDQTSTSFITPIADESGSAPVVDEAGETSAAPASLPETAPEPVPPKLIRMVQPEYPQEALLRGIEGWVELSLQVNAAGDVVAPRVESTSRGRIFNRAALNAVEQWKYEPRSDGSDERLRVRVQFRHSK